MKKWISLLLAAVMLLSLAACSKDPAGPSGETGGSSDPDKKIYEGVRIKFWSPVGDMGYFGELAATFKEMTGCTVDCAVVPWSDLSTKYVTAFLSNSGPDVFYLTSGLVADLYDGDCLTDLYDYFPAEDLAERNYMDAVVYKDILYAIPYNVSSAPRAWAFNLDILRQVGYDKAPETWDEMVDAAVKIKNAGICKYPMLLPMNGGSEAMLEGFLSLLWSNGGAVTDEEYTKITLDTPECIETCRLIRDLVYKYEVLSQDCLSLDTMAVSTQFYKSNCAMCPVYADSPLYSNADKVFYVTTKKGEQKKIYEPFDYVVTFGVGNNGHLAKSCLPVDSLGISNFSANKEAAADFIRFLCKEGYQIYYNYYKAMYEGKEAVLIPPLFKGDTGRDIVHEWHREMAEHLEEHTFAMPLVAGAASMDMIFFSNVQLLIMGELTPEECAANMQKECTAAMQG